MDHNGIFKLFSDHIHNSILKALRVNSVSHIYDPELYSQREQDSGFDFLSQNDAAQKCLSCPCRTLQERPKDQLLGGAGEIRVICPHQWARQVIQASPTGENRLI